MPVSFMPLLGLFKTDFFNWTTSKRPLDRLNAFSCKQTSSMAGMGGQRTSASMTKADLWPRDASTNPKPDQCDAVIGPATA